MISKGPLQPKQIYNSTVLEKSITPLTRKSECLLRRMIHIKERGKKNKQKIINKKEKDCNIIYVY